MEKITKNIRYRYDNPRSVISISEYKTDFINIGGGFSAIWDTGATNTVISKQVARELKLKPISTTELRVVNGTIICNVYKIIINIANRIKKVINVTEAELGNIDVLIGMDIIGDGDFTITGDYPNRLLSYSTSR
ncbi:retroviral-like aspartic protease family protein [Candidatus Saccharibacteria bacterium]|nr:retroviral-like aspartic protease family protein [Candidatus Saccharibacteria bacterium]